MWRSDAVLAAAAAHPTFSLVLYNYKLRNFLQNQGRVILKSTNDDANNNSKYSNGKCKKQPNKKQA